MATGGLAGGGLRGPLAGWEWGPDTLGGQRRPLRERLALPGDTLPFLSAAPLFPSSPLQLSPPFISFPPLSSHLLSGALSLALSRSLRGPQGGFLVFFPSVLARALSPFSRPRGRGKTRGSPCSGPAGGAGGRDFRDGTPGAAGPAARRVGAAARRDPAPLELSGPRPLSGSNPPQGTRLLVEAGPPAQLRGGRRAD